MDWREKSLQMQFNVYSIFIPLKFILFLILWYDYNIVAFHFLFPNPPIYPYPRSFKSTAFFH